MVTVNEMNNLTFKVLELKALSLCHRYRARPACTSVQSDQALYCWLTKLKNIQIGISKIDNGQSKKIWEVGQVHLNYSAC
jgi:hypothetical protein